MEKNVTKGSETCSSTKNTADFSYSPETPLGLSSTAKKEAIFDCEFVYGPSELIMVLDVVTMYLSCLLQIRDTAN